MTTPDTLIQRLRSAQQTCEQLHYPPELAALLGEAADHIGLLTRSLEMMERQIADAAAERVQGWERYEDQA